MIKDRKSQEGFTFVEMAMALLISGMIFIGLMRAFYLYNLNITNEHTQEALRVSKDAISEYLTRRSVYPCPASPSKAPGEPDYGVANCSGANVEHVIGRNGLDVYIGAVPITTIQPVLQDVDLSYRDTVDGWGNRLTYAVTGILTDPVTFNNKEGAISIVDEFGNSVVEPSAHAHMLVLSHGPDGIGAYSAEGAQAVDCSTITITPPPGGPTVASISEIENCDADAQFLSGLSSTNPDTYNDDIVNFMIDQVYNLWEYIPGKANAVQNTNPGNVGLGKNDPAQKLDIAGNLNANTVRANKICAEDNTTCLETDKLGGAGMSCSGPNMVARAISENNVVCDTLFTAPITQSCDPGYYAVGIKGDGTLICEPFP